MTKAVPHSTLDMAQAAFETESGNAMTNESKGEVTPTPGQTENPPARSGMAHSLTELDVPSLAGQFLSQYQNLLVHLEEDTKRKALSSIKEEAHLIHHQALKRLRSMEAEIQERVQAVLDQARQGIFGMVREELEAIFETMEGNLQSLLHDEELGVGLEGAESAEQQEEEHWDKPAELDETQIWPQPLEGEKPEAGAPEQERRHREVRLELLPPLDLRPLLEFYRGLSATKEVRILRALGSTDKGVSSYIRPRQPASVAELVRTLPGVQDVEDGSSTGGIDKADDSGADNRRTLRVLLTPPGK